jgi:membrane protease YdiL (CAAX protease family)
MSERGIRPGRLAKLAADHPLTFFFTLAYAFAWSFFLPMVASRALTPRLIVAGAFGPTVAAIVTHRLATGSYRAFRFLSTWPRVIFGAGIGCVLVIVAYVVLPGLIAADPRRLHWGVLVSFVYNASTLLGGPLGEEPGWRGYALPRLEERFGPVRASLLMALLWSGWHLPLFLVPGWTSAPLWTYMLLLIGVSAIMTTAVNVARFSVIAAIATHAAFNTVSRFLAGLFGDVEPRVQIPFVTLMALSGLAVGAVLTVVTRGGLAYHPGREARAIQARPRDPVPPFTSGS